MDIRCAICSEPWDSYGVNNGDMARWEAKLFRAGAGCPACEGQAPEGTDAGEALEAHCRSVIFGGTDDPHAFEAVNTLGLDHTPPKWIRPADETVIECADCDTRIMRSADDGECYWQGRDASRLDRMFDDASPDEFQTIDGQAYCPSCFTVCTECNAHVRREDTYPDPRSAGCYTRDDRVCSDECHSRAETEEQDRAWDDWACRDFKRAIVKLADEGDRDDVEMTLDRMGDAAVWEIFHDACEANNDYWQTSDEGVWIDVEDPASMVQIKRLPCGITCEACKGHGEIDDVKCKGAIEFLV